MPAPLRGAFLPQTVREDLLTLAPPGPSLPRETDYLLKKGSFLLLAVLIAASIASLTALAAQGEREVDAQGSVERSTYGGVDKEIRLEEEELGSFSVRVTSRQYDDAKAQEMAEEVFRKLEDIVPGNNSALEEVREDLVLPTEVEGYPFAIQWESSCYEALDNKGHVRNALFRDDEAVPMEVVARLRLQGKTYARAFPLTVRAPLHSETEKLRAAVEEAMASADAESATAERYRLPREVAGYRLQFREVRKDPSGLLFLGLLLAGILGLWSMDLDLRRAVTARERQLQLSYPQVVSKLVLYLGAGMSARSVFFKMAQEYLDRESGEKAVAYEEICRTVRELESGVSEADAYIHFGKRCRERQYIKLASLLTQNLLRGNDRLLAALQEEAALALENRKAIARKLGEEAGTKLLVPMVMMLAVTLVMIMIPAYLGFSV